jgi:hypothetical protein
MHILSVSSFIPVAADDLEMPVSCAKHLSDLCSVCYNLAFVSSNFSSVSTWCFLAGFLSISDPVDLIFLISSWMPLCLELYSLEIYDKIVSSTS